jgi:hypothetical protein
VRVSGWVGGWVSEREWAGERVREGEWVGGWVSERGREGGRVSEWVGE